MEAINIGKRIMPTLVIGDQTYTNPDNATLRDVLNIDQEDVSKCYDTVIVGAGAAGLTASIYIQRDKFDSLILERKNIGGNAFLTETIENYPGFTKISCPELMERKADCRLRAIAQVASATGEGVIASYGVRAYLKR